MRHLKILQCGPATSVQDGGRTGYRRYGVSSAGAMDRLSLAQANALVGNAPGSASIEFALLGGAFSVCGGGALLAAAGPGVSMSVEGRPVPAGQSAHAPAGATVVVGPLRQAVYAYLAVADGVATEPVMGSRSVHPRSGIGGTFLRAGDRLPLPVERPALPSRTTMQIEPASGPLRIMLGPQGEFFTREAIDRLLSEPFVVESRSDRMGYRLRGLDLPHALGYNIVSDGVVPGSIQVSGDRQPIVLMRDCQTTGGYPKIATLISADVDRLAQIRPGSALTFRLVSREEAVAAAREFQTLLERIATSKLPLTASLGSQELLAHNLISGVVDAREP